MAQAFSTWRERSAAVRLGIVPPKTESVTRSPTRQPTADVPPPPPLPNEQRKWYFAEGSTRLPFEVSFALQNPNPQPTVAHFIFLAADGKQAHTVRLSTPGQFALDAAKPAT